MSYSLCQGWIPPPVFERKAFKCPLHACSVTQSYPIICEPMNCSPSDPSVHGILQARILEWVAISFSRGSSQPRDRARVSYSLPTELRGKPINYADDIIIHTMMTFITHNFSTFPTVRTYTPRSFLWPLAITDSSHNNTTNNNKSTSLSS